MTSVQSIREQTQHIPNEDMRKICIRIIDEVERQFDRENQGLWTFQTFSKWVGLTPTDRLLHECIQLLVSQREAQLLDMHFLFFDPNDPDDPGEEVDDNEVSVAFSKGYFVHPESGEEIADFEEALVPYFVPSEGLART